MDAWEKQRVDYYNKRIKQLVKDLETVNDRDVVMVLFSIKLFESEIRRLVSGSSSIPESLLIKQQDIQADEDDCESCKI